MDSGSLTYLWSPPGLQWGRQGKTGSLLLRTPWHFLTVALSCLCLTWFCRGEGWLSPMIKNHCKIHCGQGEGTPFIIWTVLRFHCLSLIRLMNQLASFLKWFLLFPLLGNSAAGFEREKEENSAWGKDILQVSQLKRWLSWGRWGRVAGVWRRNWPKPWWCLDPAYCLLAEDPKEGRRFLKYWWSISRWLRGQCSLPPLRESPPQALLQWVAWNSHIDTSPFWSLDIRAANQSGGWQGL